MADDGPPPYTLCDPYGEQGWMPRNVALSLACLAVNVGFLVFYYRLHQLPASYNSDYSSLRRAPAPPLSPVRSGSEDEDTAAVLVAQPKPKRQSNFSPNWGFGGKHYIYRESLNGVFIAFPTVLWFFVFHATNSEYACAWAYGLYGFPLLFLQCAIVPLLVYWIGVTARSRYYQAFDLMDIRPTDRVLLLPGYRGGYLVDLCKRLPQGYVSCVDAYDTRWQPESRLWIAGNIKSMGLTNVDVQTVTDWKRLPYVDGQFDVVIGCFMSHMLYLNQPYDTLSSTAQRTQDLLRECRRVSRPGGQIHLIEMIASAPTAEANLLAAGFHGAKTQDPTLWFGLIPEKLVSGNINFPRSRSRLSNTTGPASGQSGTTAGGFSAENRENSRATGPASTDSNFADHFLVRAGRSARSASAPPVPDRSTRADMVLPWTTGQAWETHFGLRLGLLVPIVLGYVAGVFMLGHNWRNNTLSTPDYMPYFNQAGQAVLVGLWPVPVLCFWIHETMSVATHFQELAASQVVKVFLSEVVWLPLQLALWVCFVFLPSYCIDYYLAQSVSVVALYAIQIVVNFSLWMIPLFSWILCVGPAWRRHQDRKARVQSSEVQRLLGVVNAKHDPRLPGHLQFINRQRSMSFQTGSSRSGSPFKAGSPFA